MKKTILTLFVCLACIMLANARWKTPPVIDTLAKRVINGLEVIPIRTTYPEKTFWKLRVSDFDKHFQKFESKYPGGLRLESEETEKAMYDWQDHVWTVVPSEIKALEGIDIRLFIDKEGNVFTADFSMTDEVFQKLNTLSRNTLKNLYRNLIKEKCEIIKNMEFHPLRWENEHERACMLTVCGSRGIGKDYVTRSLYWYIYSLYGTSNPLSIIRSGSIYEKMQEKKKSEK